MSSGVIASQNMFVISALRWGLLFLLAEWLQRDKQHALQFGKAKVFNYMIVRYCVYATIIALMWIYTGKVQTFIYFQF